MKKKILLGLVCSTFALSVNAVPKIQEQTQDVTLSRLGALEQQSRDPWLLLNITPDFRSVALLRLDNIETRTDAIHGEQVKFGLSDFTLEDDPKKWFFAIHPVHANCADNEYLYLDHVGFENGKELPKALPVSGIRKAAVGTIMHGAIEVACKKVDYDRTWVGYFKGPKEVVSEIGGWLMDMRKEHSVR